MNDVEDKKRKAVLERIRAMMARTTANGCTEAEAEAAASIVDKLMADYEIDLSETLVGEQEIVKLDIALNKHPVRYAAQNLAKFCDCKVWYDSNNGKNDLCFLGLEVDVSVCEYLLLLFQRSIDRETTQFSVFDPDIAFRDAIGQRNALHSFGIGMARRLGERLLEMKSKRDFTQKARGQDLVLAKAPLIDEAFLTLGINLGGAGTGPSIRDNAAYNAGRGAGDKVQINPGRRRRAWFIREDQVRKKIGFLTNNQTGKSFPVTVHLPIEPVKFKLVFTEERTQVRRIAVEVDKPEEPDSPGLLKAAEEAIAAYESGKYDTSLEEAEADSSHYGTEVGYYNEKGEYVVILPMN